MTALDLVPHWSRNDDWSGALLLIVPAAELPVAVADLVRRVREQIENDAALYDVVRVAGGPARDAFEDPALWGRALLAALIGEAMPKGYLLAPRAILGIVVVGETDERLKKLASALQKWESLKRLQVRLYGCRVGRDERRGGVAAWTIRAAAGIATKMMTAYDEKPEIAIDEDTFLAEVAGLIERRVIVAVPGASSASPPRAPHKRPAPQSPPRSHTGSAPRSQAANYSQQIPAPEQPAPRRLGTPPRVFEPQAPVYHGGEDVILVDGRSPLRRLKEPAPVDAEAIDRLSAVTNAISLAYFVIVPDEESSSRKVSRRYRRIAVDLDRLLATVVADGMTGRDARVAVEVLTAVSPLHKHGVLRAAGELTENDLPKVPTDLFDHAGTVDALLGAAQRTARAFHARKVQVVSLHYLFLSSVELAFANTSGTDWDRLLRFARVTWVEIGPETALDSELRAADLGELPSVSPSPFGFHVVSDRHDVPAIVRNESSGLYVYGPPCDPPRPTAEEGARSWWRRRWVPAR